MHQYFESEMRLLQEAAQEFAEYYPEQASMLNLKALKDRDPYIERLLEGMAYLTAHVKKRIDDGVPDISENILRQICPSLIRLYPSTCVLEFKPKTTLQKTEQIKRGTEVKSRLVGKYGTQCRFTTCYDTPVVPIKIQTIEVNEKNDGGCQLSFQFRWNTPHDKSLFDLSEMPLFIHADPGLTHSVLHALTYGVKQVSLSYSTKGKFHKMNLGGQELISDRFVNSAEGLLPNDGNTHPGFTLLQDYFGARERFYFVTLHGLNQVEWQHCDDVFSVIIETDVSLPPGSKLSIQNIRLNCAIAVNLFTADSEPIKLNSRQMEYPIIPDVAQPKEVSVYQIDKVEAFDRATGNRVPYLPMYEMNASADKNHKKYYFNETSRDPGTGRRRSILQVLPTEESKEHVLSCEITATNAHIPRQTLQHGDIGFGGNGFPAFVEVTNITRPTQFLVPPDRSYYQWQLVSLLTLKMSSIHSVEVLQRLLSLFDWTERSENQKRITGIQEIKMEPKAKVIRGVFRQGIEIELCLDESHYPSLSDMYLFGRVLHQFFAMYTAINEYVQTRVICLPSYKEFLWLPLVGQKSPL
jgi:type VI secretion system protein ImpG